MRRFLLKLARLPVTTGGRVLLIVLWGAAIILTGPTDGRSLGVLAPFGVVILLHGWGILTNWGGIWDRIAEEEREHHEASGHLPLGQTRAGRAIRELNRHDDEVNRGMGGAAALLMGPTFIVLGVLAAAGILDVTG